MSTGMHKQIGISWDSKDAMPSEVAVCDADFLKGTPCAELPCNWVSLNARARVFKRLSLATMPEILRHLDRLFVETSPPAQKAEALSRLHAGILSTWTVMTCIVLAMHSWTGLSSRLLICRHSGHAGS